MSASFFAAQVPDLGNYGDRAAAARDQAHTAYERAAQVQSAHENLRHSDPAYDPSARVARLYREMGDTLTDLAETFEGYEASLRASVA